MRYLIFLIVSNRVLTLVVTNKRGNMSEAIKKIGIPTATIVSALLLVIAPAILSTGAFAIAPTEVTQTGGLHFVGQPDLQVNKEFGENGRVTSASLTATGEVAGAGTYSNSNIECHSRSDTRMYKPWWWRPTRSAENDHNSNRFRHI